MELSEVIELLGRIRNENEVLGILKVIEPVFWIGIIARIVFMTTYKRQDVVLIPFPFSDLSSISKDLQ